MGKELFAGVTVTDPRLACDQAWLDINHPTIKNRYDEQISPYYAASRIWIDAIIDPAETRKVISMGIEMANHKKAEKPYNVGVIQT